MPVLGFYDPASYGIYGVCGVGLAARLVGAHGISLGEHCFLKIQSLSANTCRRSRGVRLRFGSIVEELFISLYSLLLGFGV